MNINIEPFPQMETWGNRFPGRKVIVVDGVRWGVINMDRHGCWGTSYWFKQIGGEMIHRNDGNGKPREVKVRSSSKQYRRGEADEKPATLADRLMAETKALIAEGLLRHPEIVAREQLKMTEHLRLERKKTELAELAEFEARAAEALKPISNYVDADTLAVTVKAVVDAMRWAQTK
jgi:hypothetical protein